MNSESLTVANATTCFAGDRIKKEQIIGISVQDQLEVLNQYIQSAQLNKRNREAAKEKLALFQSAVSNHNHITSESFDSVWQVVTKESELS